MKKKWLSIFLVLAMVLGMMPAMAFADDAKYLDVKLNDCTEIGTMLGDLLYLLEVSDGENYDYIRFDGSFGTYEDPGYAMIAAMNSNFCVEGQNFAPIGDSLLIDNDVADNNFELLADYTKYDFTDCYGYWLMNDNLDTYYVVLNFLSGSVNSDPFTLSVGEIVGSSDGGYTPESGSPVTLYTVAVPFGTEQVTVSFPAVQLAYAYDTPKKFVASCEAVEDDAYWLNGQTTAIVKEDSETYLLPNYLQVQDVYNTDYSGGDLLYAIQFTYTHEFEVKVNGSVCDVSSVAPASYTYDDFMNGTTIVSVYTVSVPCGTDEVSISLSDPGLLYNYSSAGKYLAGLYQSSDPLKETDEVCTGLKEFTVSVDSDGKDGADYIHVQKPYKVDWSGSYLLYAITFEEETPAATGDSAFVRIVGPDNDEYIPYMEVAITDGMTLKALTEKAVQAKGGTTDWSDYGFLNSISNCDIGSDYWMSMLNDSGDAFNTGTFETIEVHAGDLLVLYAGSDGDYAWLTPKKNGDVTVYDYNGTEYITGQASFHLQGNNWSSGDYDVEGASITVTDPDGTALSASTDYGFYEDAYVADVKTNDLGVVSIEFYGSCAADKLDDYTREFELRAEKDGIVTAFCKVTLTKDDLVFSQPEGTMPAAPLVHKEDIADDVQAMLDDLLAEDPNKAAADYTADWALAMKAAGKTPTDEELDNFLKNVMAAAKSSSTTVAQKAKWAIALSAMGIDATQIPGDDDTVINLVEAVYSASEDDINAAFGPDAYVAPFIVNLYELGFYDIPEDALSEDFLIGLILDGQDDKGGWYSEYGGDGTGMVLPALAAVSGESGVSDAIDKAVACLSGLQDDDGSFGNIWTTVMVSMGLHAAGVNDHSDTDFIKDDCAIGYILSQKDAIETAANSTLDAQAAWALATLQNLDGSGNENLFKFDGPVSVYTDWPDARLLTSIAVTEKPAKTTYAVGEAFDPDGLVVTATFNEDTENTEVIATGYTLSEPDMTTAGNKTVTVTYQGQTASFVISVKSEDGNDETESAYITVKGLDETIVSKRSEEIVVGETTAMDLLKSVLDSEGIAYVIKNSGTYVSSINGLAEYDEGPNSGWLYKVNGKLPGNGTVAACDYQLQNGDNLIWYYTKDYLEDESVKETLPAGTTPEEPTGGDGEGTSYFIDVDDSDWYEEYAEKAAELDLFAGYDAGTDEEGNQTYEFRGGETMTRAMFVTVLRAINIKLKGETGSAPDAGFADVADGAWYEEAVNWAYAEGITAGKGDSFGVDDPVSREQMAVFLYAYAKSAGKVTGEVDLSKLEGFSDADEISDYAKEAIAWLVGEGLMAGRGGGKLAPGATSTRAEVAAFLVNAYEYLSK